VRHTLEALRPATQAGLPKLAREVNPLALRWGLEADCKAARGPCATVDDER